MLFRRRGEAVLGHNLPAPRVTPLGARLFALYFVLPTLFLLALFDVIIWAMARWLFGACVAVWCFF